MSLWSKRASIGIGPVPAPTADQYIPIRSTSTPGLVNVTADSAMRVSAVWACLRLRADLISTMPLNVYRQVGDIAVQVPTPPVLVEPGGQRVCIDEWMYSTQIDLDRVGNTFGLITAVDGYGFPARIDLVQSSSVTVKVRRGELWKIAIDGVNYDPSRIWHEKQFTGSGLHVGLSPVAYAAYTLGQYLSVQEFALSWFGNGGVPAGHLKNTAKTFTPQEAATTKDRFKVAVQNRDVFVSGADWDYDMIQAEDQGSAWLDAQKFGVQDACRFFGVPGDMVDASGSDSHITYANITQRNLQFLITNLGPAITRRESALSRMVPSARSVRINSQALLRMDPLALTTMLAAKINSRTLTVTEARELDNMPPLTAAQIAEFVALFGAPKTTIPPVSAPQEKLSDIERLVS